MSDAPKSLPDVLKLVVRGADVAHAICGSQTRCALANAIERTYPLATYWRVKPNGITITYERMVYNYDMPDEALNLIAKNDTGELSLVHAGRVLKFGLKRNGKRKQETITKARQEQVNEARKRRAAEGRPDKPYSKKAKPNYRMMAAIKAGKKLKRAWIAAG